jgi:hypothetical protein
MSPTADGMYCPGCGYDLRGLSSTRCPECGLTINAVHAGIIPWERRKGIGYFPSFFRTLVIATFGPTRLARAAGAPIDLRSARLFRWIVRALVIPPILTLFALTVYRHGGPDCLAIVHGIDGPAQAWGPFLQPFFLWTVGATFWPTLPVGLIMSVVLATGISHWLFMKQLDPMRRNRAMTFSFYLCAPLGWTLIPCLVFSAAMVLSDSDWVGASKTIHAMAQGCGLVGILSVFVLLLATVNSARAINVATQCGSLGSLAVGAGIAAQALASLVICLGLFPMTVGLFRLMISSLWR